MYICICEAISDTIISDAIEAGARTVDEVGDRCGAGTVCGNCRQMIETLLEASDENSHRSGPPAKEDI